MANQFQHVVQTGLSMAFRHLLIILSLFAAAARADFAKPTLVRHPGYHWLAGPDQAKGVIIWNPGYDGERKGHPIVEDGHTPHFLDWLYGHGWDIYYMQREGIGHVRERPEHANAIIQAVSSLQDQGYERVVLGGHSAGGIYQMLAARRNLGLHAMMLFASGPTVGPVSFEQMLDKAQAGRFLVAHFKGDETIGQRDRSILAGILAKKAGPHILVHETFGLDGHGAAFKSDFARQYSDCILQFLEPDHHPTGQECDEVMQSANPRDAAPVGAPAEGDQP